MNPKLTHILAEFVQIGGAAGSFAAIAGSLNPLLGAACAALSALATIAKPFIVPTPVTPTPGVSVSTSAT